MGDDEQDAIDAETWAWFIAFLAFVIVLFWR